MPNSNPFQSPEAPALSSKTRGRLEFVLLHLIAFQTCLFAGILLLGLLYSGVSNAMEAFSSFDMLIRIAILATGFWLPHAILCTTVDRIRWLGPLFCGVMGALSCVMLFPILQFASFMLQGRLAQIFRSVPPHFQMILWCGLTLALIYGIAKMVEASCKRQG